MNFGEPFGGILPGARGAALAALLRTGTPLTGRGVHKLLGGQFSLGAVQQALKDLSQLGLITAEVVGSAGVHRVNEEHDAIPLLRSLASPIEMLTRVIQEEAGSVTAAILFGSIARGEAHAESDIDLAIIATDDWAQAAHLQERVQDRLGNHCDIIHLTPDQFTPLSAGSEPVIAEILRDGLVLSGKIPRRHRTAS